MSHSTTARLRHQIFRLNQREQPDLDFGLGEILPPEDLALILTEEGATWKSIIYTPLLTRVQSRQCQRFCGISGLFSARTPPSSSYTKNAVA